LPTLIESTDSKKQSIREKTIYSFDYNRSFSTSSADNEALAIQQLVAKNILLPVEKIQIKTIGNTDYVVGGTLYTYRADKPVIDKVYALKIGAPLLYTSFTSSAITNDGKFIKDGNYEEKIVEAGYDEFNNITEQAKTNDVKNAFIWDYKKYYPVADVKNAEAAAIAYTSFEADGAGNWNIPGANRAANGVTGVQCYQLNNGAITKSGLASSGTYVVSYWSKNGACSVTGTVGSTMQGKTVTVNGINWTYYEHQVTGVNEVTVSGTADIDELRLYPGNAQMTTYTYEPLVGMTSQCDARNTITYYEYDALGRLNLVRDQDGNIIKTFKYNYKQ
jgi:YD repeat-containing protein